MNLEWSWIDLEKGLMLRRPPRSAETKKKKPPVRLGLSILWLLRSWKAEDGPVAKYVCAYRGKKIKSIKTAWNAAVKRAGLGRDVTPHTLRHTRATWLMQRGTDYWEAAGHLGMSVETLCKVYGKHHPDFQKNAAEV